MSSFEVFFQVMMGHDHQRERRNCHDAVAAFEITVSDQVYRVGMVADGCGRAIAPEVGARLSVQHLARRVGGFIAEGIPLPEIPTLLFSDWLAYIKAHIEREHFLTSKQVSDYVYAFWLCTIIGVIQGPTETVTFARGDGFIRINDEIVTLKTHGMQPNKPQYGAYLVLSPTQGQWGFETQVLKTDGIEVLALGSDGWREDLNLLARLHQFTNHPRAVVREMIGWWEDEGHFDDDVAVYLLVRTGEDDVKPDNGS